MSAPGATGPIARTVMRAIELDLAVYDDGAEGTGACGRSWASGFVGGLAAGPLFPDDVLVNHVSARLADEWAMVEGAR